MRPRRFRRIADLLARAGWVIRRVLGAPDYAAYVEHVHRVHPDRTPLTADAFARDALARRYDRPGSRCC
ncbi:MAG: YbdD/YjiX family protein [Gemmatimonadaceae bacterium]|nr:YbdD/YjiX family protein [Gemmatimonadaceae bacterium]NUO95185.1 YbdD/YjiX family protein [Gemmatimonadaceae bacterium]NUP55884.1 YbdD/YjiX family protein [Gemmatimonadaceae bacterium]NUP72222.1 YbdD/YjiX family protein [Gemmatimonadaceae bacterium]NUR34678.1 YbdD/YjiX family protein [Gemmatimonadaceae bacterium]